MLKQMTGNVASQLHDMNPLESNKKHLQTIILNTKKSADLNIKAIIFWVS